MNLHHELQKITGRQGIFSDALTTQLKKYKKGEIITREGDVESRIYLILAGGVKVSYNDDGKNYIVDFWFKGDIFSAFASFIQQTPSKTEIEALEDSELEFITQYQLQGLYKESLHANKIGRIMAEKMYCHKFEKEIALLSQNAAQRYKTLLQRSPEIVARIPVKDIASYLGIHPDSLSRIRKNVIS